VRNKGCYSTFFYFICKRIMLSTAFILDISPLSTPFRDVPLKVFPVLSSPWRRLLALQSSPFTSSLISSLCSGGKEIRSTCWLLYNPQTPKLPDWIFRPSVYSCKCQTPLWWRHMKSDEASLRRENSLWYSDDVSRARWDSGQKKTFSCVTWATGFVYSRWMWALGVIILSWTNGSDGSSYVVYLGCRLSS